jgi:hypothetical protein
MKDHTLIEELLALRALGALEPQDEALLREEMGDHQPCDECRRLERGTSEVAGRLPFALEPVAVGRELEDATVAKALAARPAASVPAATGGASITHRRWARALVAVAAAVALFVGGWVAGSVVGSDQRTGAQIAAFRGTPGINLSLVYASRERGAYLVGSGLPATSSGTTYALWLFHGSTPVSAGCFEPTTQGTITTFVDASLAGAATAAVTLEPSSCPSAPTTSPILTASL